MAVPDAIRREHVLQALDDLDQNVVHPFREPRKYELLHEGRRYPPKAVVGLAAKHATGVMLGPEDFSGGEAPGQANAVLRDLGFTVESMASAPGEDWSQGEVDLIIADYFSMLRSELLGHEYSKTEHRHRLQEQLPGRSKGSIEFKHANISAVLVDLGYPYIDGYKPRGNYQALLSDRIEAYLQAHPDALQDTLAGPRASPTTNPAPRALDEVFVAVPSREEPPAGGAPSRRTGRRIDWAALDAQNRSLGRKGEEFVVELERMRLTEGGRPDLAARVEWTTDAKGDGLGYDVASFETDGRQRFIEVKTTGLNEFTPFYVSAAEVRRSEELGERYFLYRLFGFGTDARVYVLEGSLASACVLEPASYLGRLRQT